MPPSTNSRGAGDVGGIVGGQKQDRGGDLLGPARALVFCAKAAVPLMRRNKGGAIVNVASVRSVVAGGGNLQYDTTKAAVAGLTRALATDHSPEGIL